MVLWTDWASRTIPMSAIAALLQAAFLGCALRTFIASTIARAVSGTDARVGR